MDIQNKNHRQILHPEPLLNTRKKLLTVVIASAMVVGCSSGGGGAASSSSTTKINLSGGTGGSDVEGLDTLNRSGAGGEMAISHDAGGDILIYKNAPEYEEPAPYSRTAITPDLGDTPLLVTSDLTIPFLDTEPEEGTAYLADADDPQEGIFISDGDGNLAEEEERVSGVRVAKGATLRFEAQTEFSGTVDVNLTNDFELAGRLESTAYRLNINAENFIGRRSGHIDLEGTEASPSGRLLIVEAEKIINEAEINANGVTGESGQGGRGGYVILGSTSAEPGPGVENLASISATGADRTAAGSEGGEGGLIAFSTQTATLFNSGELNANGGNHTGEGGEGGKGGIVSYEAEGSLYNTGDLHANGGDGPEGGEGGTIYMDAEQDPDEVVYLRKNKLNANGGAGLNGEGGEGGYIRIGAEGSPLYLNGTFSLAGGDGGGSGEGGEGGVLAVLNTASNLADSTVSIVLSGPIDASGGDAARDSAAAGGEGGQIAVTLNDEDDIDVQNDIILVYDALVATGGAGIPGGHGGGFYVVNAEPEARTPLSGGAIVNEMDINVSGGDLLSSSGISATAVGGDFGNVQFATEDTIIFDALEKSIHNTGRIVANEGDGFNQNAIRLFEDSYNVSFTAYQDVLNEGPISSNGSNDVSSSDTARGWGAGRVTMESKTGEVVNTGRVSLKGGSGRLNGGSGGEFFVNIATDSTATMNGAIIATGGDANSRLEGSRGGNGGTIWAISDFDDTFSALENRVDFNNRNVNVEEGSGQSDGASGCVIDGVYVLSGSDETCPDDEDLEGIVSPFPDEEP